MLLFYQFTLIWALSDLTKLCLFITYLIIRWTHYLLLSECVNMCIANSSTHAPYLQSLVPSKLLHSAHLQFWYVLTCVTLKTSKKTLWMEATQSKSTHFNFIALFIECGNTTKYTIYKYWIYCLITSVFILRQKMKKKMHECWNCILVLVKNLKLPTDTYLVVNGVWGDESNWMDSNVYIHPSPSFFCKSD